MRLAERVEECSVIAERSMSSSRPLCRDYATNELFETDLPGVLGLLRKEGTMHAGKAGKPRDPSFISTRTLNQNVRFRRV